MHHQLNYEESLRRGVRPKDLQIRKDPTFEPISDVFQIKRNDILDDPEKNLDLLLDESSNSAVTMEIDLTKEFLIRVIHFVRTQNFPKN